MKNIQYLQLCTPSNNRRRKKGIIQIMYVYIITGSSVYWIHNDVNICIFISTFLLFLQGHWWSCHFHPFPIRDLEPTFSAFYEIIHALEQIMQIFCTLFLFVSLEPKAGFI